MSVLTAEQLLLVDVPVDAQPEVGSPEWARREFAKFLEYSEIHGALVSQSQAARVLGISQQAVAEYMKRGRLTRIEVLGAVYIGARELCDFAVRDRGKGGRPRKASRGEWGLPKTVASKAA